METESSYKFFLYLDSVFKDKDKLVHNQSQLLVKLYKISYL